MYKLAEKYENHGKLVTRLLQGLEISNSNENQMNFFV